MATRIIEIIKKPSELEKSDLHKIFKCVFINRSTFIFKHLISCSDSDGAGDYTKFTCKDTGYSLKIWDNYDIHADSDVHPINKIPLLSIINCLLEIGAVEFTLKH